MNDAIFLLRPSQQRQASLYARGDAKLILEMENCLKKNGGISLLNTEKLAASFRLADVTQEGALKVDQVSTAKP